MRRRDKREDMVQPTLCPAGIYPRLATMGCRSLLNWWLLRRLKCCNRWTRQEIEARFGYNGIRVTLNGEQLPSLAWDAESEQTLRELVAEMPGLPNVKPNRRCAALDAQDRHRRDSRIAACRRR